MHNNLAISIYTYMILRVCLYIIEIVHEVIFRISTCVVLEWRLVSQGTYFCRITSDQICLCLLRIRYQNEQIRSGRGPSHVLMRNKRLQYARNGIVLVLHFQYGLRKTIFGKCQHRFRKNCPFQSLYERKKLKEFMSSYVELTCELVYECGRSKQSRRFVD